MLLLLVRHAHAGTRDPERWPDDRDRPLTEKGRSVQTRASRALRALGLVPDCVLTSPWARAVQTAEILTGELRLVHPTLCEPLAREPELDALQECVGVRPDDEIVALVGHRPWLPELGSILLSAASSRVAIDLPKSGVLGIRAQALEPGAGTLEFMLRPKVLKALG